MTALGLSDPVTAAAALAPRAAELAEETERGRRLPAELSAALAEAGLYRMCVPAALGGGEQPPATMMAAIEVLAAGDAAAGWCLAVSTTSGMLAAYLDDDTAREVYGRPDAVVGGVFAPMGRAEATGDALTVTGRWSFCSNVDNCDWLMGGCVVHDGGEPRRLPSGRPDIRLVLFPAASAEVLDTWHVAGLRGTGSHDIRVEGLVVPAARSASLLSDPPRDPAPLYAFPPFGLLALGIAAVALGTARGALDDLAALAATKSPSQSSRRLAERPTVQAAVARAEAGLRAARAGLHEAVATAWASARAGGPIPGHERAACRMAATHAVETAAAAVDTAWTQAGGSALYERFPLQRRFRDVHAATQHMLVNPATWELTGRLLLGVETDDAQL